VTGEAKAADEDYLAAVEQVAETTGAPVIAAGYSFGAASALRVGLRDPRIAELILIAPPVSMIESLALSEFRGPLHVIVGGRDTYAPLAELSALLDGLPNANLDVIPKADHFFASHGLAELVELVRTSIS
jgi:pimeloyl-ACP methyl ester carboxylesterase